MHEKFTPRRIETYASLSDSQTPKLTPSPLTTLLYTHDTVVGSLKKPSIISNPLEKRHFETVRGVTDHHHLQFFTQCLYGFLERIETGV